MIDDKTSSGKSAFWKCKLDHAFYLPQILQSHHSPNETQSPYSILQGLHSGPCWVSDSPSSYSAPWFFLNLVREYVTLVSVSGAFAFLLTIRDIFPPDLFKANSISPSLFILNTFSETPPWLSVGKDSHCRQISSCWILFTTLNSRCMYVCMPACMHACMYLCILDQSHSATLDGLELIMLELIK